MDPETRAEAPPYGNPPPAGRAARVTVHTLNALAQAGTPITMLTAYDASFATLADRAGVDVLLVGDSLGNVIQGHESTLPVTLADVVYHTRCVAAGCASAMIVADLPFGTYQQGPAQAYASAVAVMQAGAHMVKVEGGAWLAATVEFLTLRAVPVCGHIGLLPQSVNVLGGYRVQGKTRDAAARLRADASALASAGASMLVVECVPASVGEALTREASVPVIGIGAGPQCAGQVLVVYDVLGIQRGRPARFVRNFLQGQGSVEAALAAYVSAVRERSFPGPEHCF
ncbi:MAG: 3-methyl-2-oxobutanoate hydroxymethyltransferase [Burkholderiales bacterium]|nr:3-methyl-2-oxobutanoate hydroxymethyltransferase [Burkholderiales bacterium]